MNGALAILLITLAVIAVLTVGGWGLNAVWQKGWENVLSQAPRLSRSFQFLALFRGVYGARYVEPPPASKSDTEHDAPGRA